LFVVSLGGGAAPRKINLPHLYSHTSGDLHSGASKVMATCLSHPSDRQLGLLASLQIWRDMFLGALAYAGCQGEMVSLERECWSGSGGSIVLLRLRRWEVASLGPRQHEDIPRLTCHRNVPRCVQQTCSSTHKALLAMVLSSN
jgi:hypothetical protein